MQRWLKFVKYLPDFGIQPVVYTVDNPDYALKDDSLVGEVSKSVEVIKKKIFEPNSLLKPFENKQKHSSAGFLDEDPGFIDRFLRYVRANYLIPDARKFWIRPSIKQLAQVIKNKEIDLVITTGPPHSCHLIGLGLKKTCGIKWVSDFRDPWTQIDYFKSLPLSDASLKKHKELEKKVLENSDAVIVVGKSMKEEFEGCQTPVHVITNGYDGEDLSEKQELDQEFSISHIGLMNADRNPKTLWKVLSDMLKESEEFARDLRIKLIGDYASEVQNSIYDFGLENHVDWIGYLPHQEAKKYQKSSQLLLISVNRVPSAKMILTGKLFEYLQSRRPILGIGPVNGDLGEVLRRTDAGTVVDFDDADQLKKELETFYTEYKAGRLKSRSKEVDLYHRKNLTACLAEILKQI